MKKKLIAKWTTRFFSQREINHLSETNELPRRKRTGYQEVFFLKRLKRRGIKPKLRNKFVYKHAIIGLFILFFSLITSAPAYSAPLVNGGVISEAISVPYEEDSYTFTANAGEGVQIRIADTSSNDFFPAIWLYNQTAPM